MKSFTNIVTRHDSYQCLFHRVFRSVVDFTHVSPVAREFLAQIAPLRSGTRHWRETTMLLRASMLRVGGNFCVICLPAEKHTTLAQCVCCEAN